MTVRAALQVLLDCMDFTKGNCNPTEMVGAVVPIEVIENASRALRERSRRWAYVQAEVDFDEKSINYKHIILDGIDSETEAYVQGQRAMASKAGPNCVINDYVVKI